MRRVAAAALGLVLVATLGVVAAAAPRSPDLKQLVIRYRAYDGKLRPAVLLLPASYDGSPIPLVISPHGRGLSAEANADLWGNLPARGGFAVIDPGGEGRVLADYSWGAPGQIADLARMPAIARAHGVNVDSSRVYAIGGSMGGQEVLLLLATHPRLLAGVVAFDPATDMAHRYYDFARLPHGRLLQARARVEIGGTPAQVPRAYALRSPASYVDAIAFSGVPLQIYWSVRDRIIRDQFDEAALLAARIIQLNPSAKVWDFQGTWDHTAEMHANRRLPRALLRFGLLPAWAVPPLPGVRQSPVRSY